MSRKLLLSGVAAVAISALFTAPSAKADQMQAALSNPTVTGGNLVLPVGGTSTNGNMDWVPTASGVFDTKGSSEDTFGSLSGLPLVLFGNTIDTSSRGAGTLTVFIVASQQTSLKGLTTWLSSFSVNNLNASLSNSSDIITEATYFKEGNVVLTSGESAASVTAGATLLQSFQLSSTGTTSDRGFNQETIGTPWSVIEAFTINASSGGQYNDTINLDAVIPEPASLSLLGGALVAFGAWRRKKSQKA